MGELAGRGVRLPVGDSVLKPCAPRRWCRVGSGGGGGEGWAGSRGSPNPAPRQRTLLQGDKMEKDGNSAATMLHLNFMPREGLLAGAARRAAGVGLRGAGHPGARR